MRGKIIKGIAGFYYVHNGHSRVYECKAKGIFRNKKIKPLVGDNVEFTILDEIEGTGNIIEIYTRTSELIRPAVANIDQALVIFAAADPNPNLNLLDRFLIMMEQQSITTSICFNKRELISEEKINHLSTIYKSIGYPVYLTSAKQQSGITSLQDFIRGKTTVLAGPSGVGKSTILNLIQPKAQMEVGAISEKIKRGKHTTRHSELFYVEHDTFIMDTPGFSSMTIGDLEAQELRNYFPEFTAYEEECKFLGCIHVGERVCGVKNAVSQHKISESRYDNYLNLYKELKDKRRY